MRNMEFNMRNMELASATHFPGLLVRKLYFAKWRIGEYTVLSALTQVADKGLFQKPESWKLCGM